MNDLLSLVIGLQALPAPEREGPPPQWWGRAAHALLLRSVQAVDPRLAEELHEGDDLRPFTASNLLGPKRCIPANNAGNASPGLLPSGRYALRFTACQAALAQALAQAARAGPLAPGQIVELDGYLFRVLTLAPNPAPEQPPAEPVEAAAEPPVAEPVEAPAELAEAPAELVEAPAELVEAPDNEPAEGAEGASVAFDRLRQQQPWARPERTPAAGWEGQSSYQALSAPYLLSQIPAPRRLTLQFASPTGFRSNGRQIPLPLPGLVFGSLLERWNAFAPLAFPPEVRRYAEECLLITRFELRSHGIPTKGGGTRLGAVGVITYTTQNYDRYWMSVCAILAEFALYAGVGAGVSQGLGQCRRLPEGERTPARPAAAE